MQKYLAFLTALLLSAAVSVSASELKIAAGPAPFHSLLAPNEAAFEAATGIDLVLVQKLPSTGFLLDLDTGSAEGVVTGMDLAAWQRVLDARQLQLADPPKAYSERVIGRDPLYVISHPEVGVAELDFEDLRNIFSGSVRSWGEVGGPDLPIRLFLASETPGINFTVQKVVLDGGSFSPQATRTGAFEDVVRKVAETPGAIGFCPQKSWEPGARILDAPDLGRPFFLVSKGRPSPQLAAFTNFLRKLMR